MMTKFKIVATSLLLALASIAHGDQERSLKQLDWLIGAWDFDDFQIKGDYRETGTRVCTYALDDQYIFCESRGATQSGKERTYVFYINYNKLDDRFEMTCMFGGGFPRKLLYILDVSEDGRQVGMDNRVWSAEGLSVSNPATITYNGSDRYVWDSLSEEPDPDTGERAPTFRDVVTRQK